MNRAARATVVLSLALFARPLFAQDRPPKEAGPFREPDLVEIVTLDPTVKLDVRYATPNNLVGRPVYSEARVFLQRPAAEALVRVHRALAEKGYGLVLFDGYRPWAVTKLFWDLTPEGKKDFVANPAKGSRHNRGSAIDLSLFDRKTGATVEMPSAYDEMSERAFPTYAGGEKTARERRDLLRQAMEAESFFVYPFEWWHFDYKDWRDYPLLDVPFSALGAPKPAPPAPFDLARARVVDLTHPFDERTLYWPTSPSSFQLDRLSYGPVPAGFFYAANAYSAPEHGGTHLDAPIHFAEGKKTADQVPVRQLVAPAVVLDVTAQAAADDVYRLSADDVRAFEAKHGPIPPGAIVLLRTGWGPRWPDRKRVFGDDTPNDASKLRFPAYGKDAAELLVNGRKVGALGLDTPSLDHGPSKDFVVHRIAAAADVPGLENVANLEELPPVGAWVAALPMKIAGGSGGPLRIVAFLPR